MAVYKVHIKTGGDKTTYTTNATTLATVSYNQESDKWHVSAPRTKKQVSTKEEADDITRKSITAFFASSGLTPNFINE